MGGTILLLIVAFEIATLAQVNNGISSAGTDDDDFIVLSESTNLVPGFAPAKKAKTPVPGFGVNGELNKIRIEEQDLREAEERLRRYDRNSDQVLDADELKEGRWADSPIQFDRDQDGRLSVPELALRFAQRRASKPQGSMPRDSQTANAVTKRQADRNRKQKEKPSVFDKQSSYRIGDKEEAVRTAALPDWFKSRDTNRDNQVSMKETGWTWNEDTLTCFNYFDINRDGFITSKECMIATKDGYTFGALDRSPKQK